MIKRFLQIFLVTWSGLALLAPWAASGQAPATSSPARAKTTAMAESSAEYRGVRFEPNDRRDPFLNPLLFKKQESIDEEVPRGNPPPGIAGMYINQVELVGFSVSPEGITAVCRGTDKRVYFLHTGDRMFDGYIKSISPDSVLLTRETKLRSGKVLIQEVTKRLRTP